MSRSAPGSGSSLDEGKNNSRAADGSGCDGCGSQSCDCGGGGGQATISDFRDRDDETERYDCRDIYENMELEAEDGDTAPFRCNSWDCYCCAHRMRCNLIEELDRLVEQRPELRRLLTLTLDPENAPASTEERHRYLTERFNALRTELRDRYRDLSYIWIREEGESDNPHLHLLVDRYMPQSELSKLSNRVGLGHIVDIRRVNARNAAKYLTKYLTKGALHDLPDGSRRYGSSADISLDVRGSSSEENGSEWRLMMDDYQVVSRYQDGPLRREATRNDLFVQKVHGGPLGRPPPE